MDPVELTEENVSDVALQEFKEEKAARLGKKVDEIPDPYAIPTAVDVTEKTPEELEAEKKIADDKVVADEEERILKADETTLSEDELAKKKEIQGREKKVGDEIEDEELIKIEDKDLDEKQIERKKVLKELEADQVREREDLLLDKPEDTLADEEKIQVKDIKERREKEGKELFEQQVKDYAELSKLSEEEARKDIESIHKIRDKYNGDTFELSKANLNLQRLNSQKDAAIKGLEESRVTVQDVDWERVINDNALTLGGKKLSKDEAITLYRNENTDLTDALDDEAVVKLMAKEVKMTFEKGLVKEQELVKLEADKKKTKMLDDLSDADKKWTPEFKAVIDTYSPQIIMSDKFDIQELVCWAKGKAYDKDIKALRAEIEETKKRYLKLGQENSRIKTPIGGGSGAKGDKVITLSPAQQNEAWSMFPQAKDDEECFKMYAETEEHRKKLAEKHK